MPLPSTRVLHPDFSAHHAPAAAGGMTGTCLIRDPATDTTEFDRATGTTTAVPGPPVYAGPCRVQDLASRGDRATAAGEDVNTPSYLVQIDAAAPAVAEQWPVLITACPDDPQLVDRTLTIRKVSHGTSRFTRDLFCEDQ